MDALHRREWGDQGNTAIVFEPFSIGKQHSHQAEFQPNPLRPAQLPTGGVSSDGPIQGFYVFFDERQWSGENGRGASTRKCSFCAHPANKKT
jgi:hypothetical protein